jgi:NAD-dependent dihydropyrimidine dehydrogenase PreA subunit
VKREKPSARDAQQFQKALHPVDSGAISRFEMTMPKRDRPGEECSAPPGKYRPVVDRSRCEGKSECVDVCPFGVFEVRRIDDADFEKLPVLAKLKSVLHGRKTAYLPGSDACQACGLCVLSCPEKAIRLEVVGET